MSWSHRLAAAWMPAARALQGREATEHVPSFASHYKASTQLVGPNPSSSVRSQPRPHLGAPFFIDGFPPCVVRQLEGTGAAPVAWDHL